MLWCLLQTIRQHPTLRYKVIYMARAYKSKLAECALTPCVYRFTYPSPHEEALSAEMPDMPPDEPQFSYTLVSGDFPTITPKLGVGQSCRYFGVVVVAISNGTGSDLWVSYSIYKNGNYVCGSTSAYVGSYTTLTEGQYRFLDIAVGDTLTVYANGLGATLHTVGVFIIPTQFKPEPDGTPLFNLKYTTVLKPTFSGGNAAAYTTDALRLQGPFSRASGSYAMELDATTKKISAMPFMSDGIFWFYNGDVSQSSYYTSSGTVYPRYMNYVVPTEISYHKLGGLPR